MTGSKCPATEQQLTLGPGQADMSFRRLDVLSMGGHAHLILRQGLEAGKLSIGADAMLIRVRGD